MLIGMFRVPLSWTSADNNKNFYKKKLTNVLPSKELEMASKMPTTRQLLILPGSIKDLSIMMKNSKTLKEKDAKPICSSFNILWNINNL